MQPLLSLTHVLDNVQHPARRHRLHLDSKRVQSLQDKVQLLLEFLEVHSERRSEEIEDLARQITVIADEAEDVIHCHVVDQLRVGSQDRDNFLSSFCQDIDKVIGKINSIMGELMMVKEKWTNMQEKKSIISLPTRSSEVLPSSGKNNITVGFDEHLIRVMDELTTDEPDLKILPIVGMEGIGKTTLARNVFDDPYTIHYFDKRIWLTISQVYSSREILMRLLSDRKDQVSNETLAELGQQLHKMLFGRRYLIVMDDMWSTGAWNDLKLFFPNIRNGIRVLVTTRLSDVAVSLSSHNYYRVDFMDEDKSWNLFCQKTFGQEGCPYPELEEIGKNIAKKCNGLPLALVVIAEDFLSLKNITFPTSLKKLTLMYCSIPWKEITFIGSLPNLEVLKLHYNAVKGPEWSPVEGQFLRLKVLGIWKSELVRWRAENMHFPNLERLVLEDIKFLEEILSSVGDIPTLQRIDLYSCGDSVVN
ncbi:Disease resistance RPP13-like protein 4 [Sesamum angolense]|uniref:Disease resistance RPP13-like protein 4 n=1 Tax=Sesamum angolense TaxID=2727404 RepID=A0AAE1VUY7_9LAMI|nr:Disease resistance RPP13-like protein 4 [Sesamum angolense]